LKYFNEALPILKKLNNRVLLANNYTNIGLVYWYKGFLNTSLDYYFKALKIIDETDDVAGFSFTLSTIGIIYNDLGDYYKAMDYFNKSLEICDKLNNRSGIAYAKANIADTYVKILNYDKAQELLIQASEIFKEIGDINAYSGTLINLGNIYIKLGKLDEAYDYFQKYLKISGENRDKSKNVVCNINIGEIFNMKGKHILALKFLFHGLELAKEIGNISLMRDAYKNISDSYSKLNNYRKAYQYHQLYNTFKDSIFNEIRSNEIGRIEAKYEYEKLQQEKKHKLIEQLKIQKEKVIYRNTIQYFGIFIFVILLFITIQVVGKYKASINIVDALIFITFLLFFEFILVVIEPFADNLTSNIPIFKLLINVGIAIVLIPIHRIETKFRHRSVK